GSARRELLPRLIQVRQVPRGGGEERRLRHLEGSGRRLVLGDLGHYRLPRPVEVLAVRGEELTRLTQLRQVAVDLRYDVAGYHVPAAHRVLGIGPVVHEADDGAEAPRHFEHRLDARHEVVRRADGGHGAGHERRPVHRLVRALEGHRAGPLESRGGVLLVLAAEGVPSPLPAPFPASPRGASSAARASPSGPPSGRAWPPPPRRSPTGWAASSSLPRTATRSR